LKFGDSTWGRFCDAADVHQAVFRGWTNLFQVAGGIYSHSDCLGFAYGLHSKPTSLTQRCISITFILGGKIVFDFID